MTQIDLTKGSSPPWSPHISHPAFLSGQASFCNLFSTNHIHTQDPASPSRVSLDSPLPVSLGKNPLWSSLEEPTSGHL